MCELDGRYVDVRWIDLTRLRRRLQSALERFMSRCSVSERLLEILPCLPVRHVLTS